MRQSQVEQQRQEQRQQQTASIQRMLQSTLLELPVAQLIDRINTEMNDNPALEAELPDYADYPTQPDLSDNSDDSDYAEGSDFEANRDREDKEQAMKEALERIGGDDDELPVYHARQYQGDSHDEIVYGEEKSFYDLIEEQMIDLDLSEKQKQVMEYIVGSLDTDGLLRKSIDTIADELVLYQYIDVESSEVEEVLRMLQTFDPAGIGARSLQECLLLQIGRREDSRLKELMTAVIRDHFDEFTHKHWQKIGTHLRLTELQTETLIGELCRLNPKPGTAMGETVGRSIHQITPDFIIDTHDDGTLTLSLNNSDIPQLRLSPSFTGMLKEQDATQNARMKEALIYTQRKTDQAQVFINALRTRNQTMLTVMREIMRWQRRYFEEGDESLLRPMNLNDISQRTGLALSTVSRASNKKYAQTRWGIIPLKTLFSNSITSEDGDEISTRKIKETLRDIIEGEDKRHPLSDQKLTAMMEERGFPIARRTVAKYREQLGIPVARLRR